MVSSQKFKSYPYRYEISFKIKVCLTVFLFFQLTEGFGFTKSLPPFKSPQSGGGTEFGFIKGRGSYKPHLTPLFQSKNEIVTIAQFVPILFKNSGFYGGEKAGKSKHNQYGCKKRGVGPDLKKQIGDLQTTGTLLNQYAVSDKTGRSRAMKYFTRKKNRTGRNKNTDNKHWRGSLAGLYLGLSKSGLKEDFNSQLAFLSEVFYQSHGGSYTATGWHINWRKGERGESNRFSFLVSLNVPRSIRFPLFLGVATGPGAFLKNRNQKPNWTLDTRLFLGLRLTKNRSQYFLQTGFTNRFKKLKKPENQSFFLSMGLARLF